MSDHERKKERMVFLKVAWFRKPNVLESIPESEVEVLFEACQQDTMNEARQTAFEMLETISEWHKDQIQSGASTMLGFDIASIRKVFDAFFQDNDLSWLEYELTTDSEYSYNCKKLGDRRGLVPRTYFAPILKDICGSEPIIVGSCTSWSASAGDITLTPENIKASDDPMATAFFNAPVLRRLSTFSSNLRLLKTYSRPKK